MIHPTKKAPAATLPRLGNYALASALAEVKGPRKLPIKSP
jgi:hypothetical protein